MAMGDRHLVDSGFAPSDFAVPADIAAHASKQSTESDFGHSKIVDSINDASKASTGKAASPWSVKQVADSLASEATTRATADSLLVSQVEEVQAQITEVQEKVDALELNGGSEIAASIRNQNEEHTGNSLTFWSGTQDEYDAIASKSPFTIYFVTEE